jgi:hypothetical protein
LLAGRDIANLAIVEKFKVSNDPHFEEEVRDVFFEKVRRF